MTNRALRRHHQARLKKNRRFYWGRDLAAEPALLAQAVATPCLCSCWVCGNQRRLEGNTIQERKAELAVLCDLQ